MIWILLIIGLLEIVIIGSTAFTHIQTESRLDNERDRSDKMLAAILRMEGEYAAAREVSPHTEPTVNSAPRKRPPLGLQGRR